MGGKLTTVNLHELWIYLTGGSLITAIWNYFYYYFNKYLIQPVVTNFIKENTAPDIVADTKKETLPNEDLTLSNEAANSRTPKRGGGIVSKNKFGNFEVTESENFDIGCISGNSETLQCEANNEFGDFKIQKVKNFDVGSIKNDPKKTK